MRAGKFTQGAVLRIARGRQALLRGENLAMRSIDLDLRGLQVVFGPLQAPVGLLGRGLRAPRFLAGRIRSVTYFDGNDAKTHVAVLIAWILFGCLAVVSGHHSFIGFAAKRREARQGAVEDSWRPTTAP